MASQEERGAAFDSAPVDLGKIREDGKMIKRILLGLGGTPYTTVAIQRAVQVAKHYGAEITGVTAISLNRLKGIGVEQKESAYTNMDRLTLAREQAEKAVSLFESACSAEGIKFQIKHEEMEDSFSLMISLCPLSRHHDIRPAKHLRILHFVRRTKRYTNKTDFGRSKTHHCRIRQIPYDSESSYRLRWLHGVGQDHESVRAVALVARREAENRDLSRLGK